MVDFSAMQDLLVHLTVSKLPKKYWGHWIKLPIGNLPKHWPRYLGRLKRRISVAMFISASADEVTSIDNQQWLSMYVYLSIDFVHESCMICICRVDVDVNASNLFELITK